MEAIGSIEYIPNVMLNIYHHDYFGFNKISKTIEYNSNPYGDAKFCKIYSFTKTDDGFSFVKPNRKKPSKYIDTTEIERLLTKYLMIFMDSFSFLDGYFTGVRTEWSSIGVNSIKFISWENGYSSDFLSFEMGNDNILYTGNPPLVDRIVIKKIIFNTDYLNLTSSKGEINYKWRLHPIIYDFVKSYITHSVKLT